MHIIWSQMGCARSCTHWEWRAVHVLTPITKALHIFSIVHVHRPRQMDMVIVFALSMKYTLEKTPLLKVLCSMWFIYSLVHFHLPLFLPLFLPLSLDHSLLPHLPFFNFCPLLRSCHVMLGPVSEFYGMEPWMVKKAIYALAREGKAEFIPGSNPDDSDAGIKFFS